MVHGVAYKFTFILAQTFIMARREQLPNLVIQILGPIPLEDLLLQEHGIGVLACNTIRAEPLWAGIIEMYPAGKMPMAPQTLI